MVIALIHTRYEALGGIYIYIIYISKRYQKVSLAHKRYVRANVKA